ncbi:hypothetical protein RI367_005548 [Sorochytrium milnesiophthora]
MDFDDMLNEIDQLKETVAPQQKKREHSISTAFDTLEQEIMAAAKVLQEHDIRKNVPNDSSDEQPLARSMSSSTSSSVASKRPQQKEPAKRPITPLKVNSNATTTKSPPETLSRPTSPKPEAQRVNTPEDLGNLQKVTSLRARFDPAAAARAAGGSTADANQTADSKSINKKHTVNSLKSRFEKAIEEAATPQSSIDLKTKVRTQSPVTDDDEEKEKEAEEKEAAPSASLPPLPPAPEPADEPPPPASTGPVTLQQSSRRASASSVGRTSRRSSSSHSPVSSPTPLVASEESVPESPTYEGEWSRHLRMTMPSDDNLTIGEVIAKRLPEVTTPPEPEEVVTVVQEPPKVLTVQLLQPEVSPSSDNESSLASTAPASPQSPVARDRSATLPISPDSHLPGRRARRGKQGGRLDSHRDRSRSDISSRPRSSSSERSRRSFAPPPAQTLPELPSAPTPHSPTLTRQSSGRSQDEESPVAAPQANFTDVYSQLTQDLEMSLMGMSNQLEPANVAGTPTYPAGYFASLPHVTSPLASPAFPSLAPSSPSGSSPPASPHQSRTSNPRSQQVSPSLPRDHASYEFEDLTTTDILELNDLVEELDKMFVTGMPSKRLSLMLRPSDQQAYDLTNQRSFAADSSAPREPTVVEEPAAERPPQRSTSLAASTSSTASITQQQQQQPPQNRSSSSSTSSPRMSSTDLPQRSPERGRPLQHQLRDNSNGQRRSSRGSRSSVESIERIRRLEEKRQETLVANLGMSKEDPKVQQVLSKLSQAQVQKVAMRVYINDGLTFKTMYLTSLMTAEVVVNEIIEKAMLNEQEEWTLFEIFNDLDLERPLKDWEIVTNVMRTWERETRNAIMIRAYGYRSSLTVNCLKIFYPQMNGWLQHRTKKGQYKRRFFELRDDGMYSAKDTKSAMTLFCPLETFDVYTAIRQSKKAPSMFCFALKSQFRMSAFEEIEEHYVHSFYAESAEKCKDWVLSIRSAKSHLDGRQHPEWFRDEEGPPPVSPPSSSLANVAEARGSKPLLLFEAGGTRARSVPPPTTRAGSSAGASRSAGHDQPADDAGKPLTLFDKVAHAQEQAAVAAQTSGSVPAYRTSTNGGPPQQPLLAPAFNNSPAVSPQPGLQRSKSRGGGSGGGAPKRERSLDVTTSNTESGAIGGKGTLMDKIDRKTNHSAATAQAANGETGLSYAHGGSVPKKSLIEMIPRQNSGTRY